MSEGPRILWRELEGKKVKTNDGQDLGEIKEVTPEYMRLEKGLVSKDKFWVPKYLADAYDGKVLWLLVTGDDIAKGYSYSSQPEREQYSREFQAFRSTPYGKRTIYLPEFEQSIRLIEEEERLQGEEERSVRDLD